MNKLFIEWRSEKDKFQAVKGVTDAYVEGQFIVVLAMNAKFFINGDFVRRASLEPDPDYKPQPEPEERQVEMPLDGGEERVA